MEQGEKAALNDMKNSQDVLLKLKNHLQNVESLLFRVTLSIDVNGPAKTKQVFQSNLVSVLSKYGFTVTDKLPAVEIIGNVAVSESSFLMNNYCFLAEGSPFRPQSQMVQEARTTIPGQFH